MTDTTHPPAPAEPDDPQLTPASRAAGAVVAGILLGGPLLALTLAIPQTATFTAGALTALTARRAYAWHQERHHEDDDDQEHEEQPLDITAHLRTLSDGTDHVLLTRLAKAAGLPNTRAARALLADAGIRVRGVRTPHGNGPGIHTADIPAAPTPAESAPSGGCCCTSDDNTNSNNSPAEGAQKGIRVERIGTDGRIVYDENEPGRYHPVHLSKART
ncbi:hypothetical protein [Streptomyces sp. C10-9-1]|uniref:hypothetical protein n=1 Tax=Streptomyces sp. C10-9-1 TaxID=1859285 RepID=UPI003F49F996